MYRFNVGGILIPVAPKSMAVKTNNKNETMSLINGGEISFIKDAGLTEYSFEFMLPQQKYPFAFYEGDFIEADVFRRRLMDLKEKKKPFLFSVYRETPRGRTLFNTSEMVSLEELNFNEEADNGFDITVNVTLKKYNQIKTLTYTVVKDGEGGFLSENKSRSGARDVPAQYVVKSGDNLWTICKTYLGDGGRYKEIAALNGINNPSRISVGQVIKFGA